MQRKYKNNVPFSLYAVPGGEGGWGGLPYETDGDARRLT